MTAKKVSIINMKGGVGKTTLSTQMARYLAEKEDKKVLLIDLDPQANATLVSIGEEELEKHKKSKKTIVGLFIDCFKEFGPFPKPEKDKRAIDVSEYIYAVQIPSNGTLDIIPSQIELSSLLKGISIGPYELNNLLTNKVEEKYDLIIIDCAPTHSILSTLAFNVTENVLIPMIADIFGAWGTKLTKDVIKQHKHDYGKDIKVLGIVFTMWDKKHETRRKEAKDEIIKQWQKDEVFQSKLSKFEYYNKANKQRTGIWNVGASTEAKDELKEFVDEFKTKIGLT
ncbi:MAG: ParA family protein [Gammaproteobacteria bacterium]|nr:ParA family protein [Gammaproteobacteria bacterium]